MDPGQSTEYESSQVDKRLAWMIHYEISLHPQYTLHKKIKKKKLKIEENYLLKTVKRKKRKKEKKENTSPTVKSHTRHSRRA